VETAVAGAAPSALAAAIERSPDARTVLEMRMLIPILHEGVIKLT
jgi:hypothetical protein